MIALARTAGSAIASGIRRVKTLVFGKSYTRNPTEIAPYGYDASPIDGINSLYCDTTVNGVTVTVGYVNTQQKAATGESRIFATDSAGTFKFNVWLKSDGTVLIGDSDVPSAYTNNLIKWTEFNSVLQAYLTAQNAAITTAISGLGGAYVTPPAPNFTSAKTTKIKVN